MKTENDLVSIIVPIYKVEPYLEKCLNTLTNQTYQNIEIVLVDDGSPDNCPKICDEWAEKDKRIKVIHKQNGGLMAAWMDGVKVATGKYVQFTDSDDYIELNTIEKLYNSIKENDADLAMCGYNWVFGKKCIKKPCLKGEILGNYEGEELEKLKQELVKKINYSIPLYRWNRLFKREMLLNNFKYCDTRVVLGEDCCITLACFLDSKKVNIIPDHLYNYIQRKSSIVRQYNKNMLEKSIILTSKIEELLKDKNYYNEETMIFEKSRMLYIITKNYLNTKINRKQKKEIYKELLTTNYALDVKDHKKEKYLPKPYRLFLKVFFTKSYFLTTSFLKAVEFYQLLRGRKL